MTDKEIIQALRCCEKEVCADGGLCPLFSDADCIVHLGEAATDLIERLTAENAKAEAERDALLGELRKSGCTYCKYATACVDELSVFGQEDCDRCGNREICVCLTCSGYGSETDKWEWRGLPEAPEEGGKA